MSERYSVSGHCALGSDDSRAKRLVPFLSASETWMCPECPGRPWAGLAMKQGVTPYSEPRDFVRNLLLLVEFRAETAGHT